MAYSRDALLENSQRQERRDQRESRERLERDQRETRKRLERDQRETRETRERQERLERAQRQTREKYLYDKVKEILFNNVYFRWHSQQTETDPFYTWKV